MTWHGMLQRLGHSTQTSSRGGRHRVGMTTLMSGSGAGCRRMGMQICGLCVPVVRISRLPSDWWLKQVRPSWTGGNATTAGLG